MAHTPYMPLYISDYLADTNHLTTEEHGAYFLLIMNYWQTGKSLPDDDRKLASICRLSEKKFKKISKHVREFFSKKNDKLTHKRLDAELLKFSEKSRMSRAAAETRWENCREKSYADAMRPHSDRNADALRTQCQTETETETTLHSSSSFSEKKGNLITEDLGRTAGAEPRNFRSAPKNRKPVSSEPDVVRSEPPVHVLTSPVFIFIPARDGKEFGVTEEIVREFEISYPHLDVRKKIQEMRMWSLSNSQKRKTMGGMLRFINNWLSKDNNRLSIGIENRKLSAVEHNQLLLERRKAQRRAEALKALEFGGENNVAL